VLLNFHARITVFIRWAQVRFIRAARQPRRNSYRPDVVCLVLMLR